MLNRSILHFSCCLLLLAFPIISQASPASEAVVAEGVAAYEQENYSKALQCFREGAADGHPVAQNSLGSMYLAGEGVPKNYKLAVK